MPPGAYPHSYIEPFWDDMYLAGPWPLPVNVNPFYLLRDEEDGGGDAGYAPPAPGRAQARRAARVTCAIARWWCKARAGALEPEVEGRGDRATHACMSNYGRVLGTARVPRFAARDALALHPRARHIAVLRGGRAYAVDVLADDGPGEGEGGVPTAMLSEAALEETLAALCERADAEAREDAARGAPDLLALTGADRDEWARHRSALENRGGFRGRGQPREPRGDRRRAIRAVPRRRDGGAARRGGGARGQRGVRGCVGVAHAAARAPAAARRARRKWRKR